MRSPTYDELHAFVEKVARKHRGCEEGWYACPWSEDYIDGDRGYDECECFAGPARALLGVQDRSERRDD